ncbi:MAG: FdtA/QdtA family cupin domain-containing protein [Patescibacteria group bacterium]|nr:FdtA/QdtA family cupin domain-containing protein [Patescibacteria group bacterium]MDE2172640.1 FdtA/QdtA family cupin domain-containing protein [Patescibacteria group bacterium]
MNKKITSKRHGIDLYKIITFPSADTKNGVLYMMQHDDTGKESAVPFMVKRTLVMKGMNGHDKRGAHTHHKTNQILICISGTCDVDLDDGERRETVRLDSPNKGLLLYPYVWHVMHNFAPGTILLDLTDSEYDERDYIRNYEDFLQQLQ